MASSSSVRITEVTDDDEIPQTAKAEQGQQGIEMGPLLPFLEKVQAAGHLTFSDAFVVHAAIRYLSAESDEDKDDFLSQIPEKQKKSQPDDLASNILVSTLLRGQQRGGAFTLTEAAQLAKMLRQVKQ